MSKPHLHLDNVSLRFRVYGVGSQSIKKKLLSFGTGGRLARDSANNFVVQAISDLSFRLEMGDKLAVIGSNGSGKSTLLRVLAGIYRPQSGNISRNGNLTAIIDPSVALDPFATGYENVNSRARLLGVPKKQFAEFAESVREISELGDYLSMPVHTYSSGMLMRLNFSLSISVSPDILLLDEWLSVTDQSYRSKAEVHMSSFVGKSNILVLASHDLELLKRVCNKGLYLRDGELGYFGDVDDAVSLYQESIMAVS